MDLWILLVLIAQFLNAGIVLFDKYLVTSPTIPRPVVYAFYVGILSGVPIILVPFGVVEVPTWGIIYLALYSGVTSIASIMFLYQALKLASPTDVVPIVGAVTAISTFAFSSLFLQEQLPDHFLIAITFLVIGMMFVGHFRFNMKALIYILLSAGLFAASSVIVKHMFTLTTFIDAFFWSRMANVLCEILLLVWPANFYAISHNVEYSPKRTKLLVLGNKAIAGVSFLLILLAIQYGEVSVINSLTALQFMFIIILTFLLKNFLPGYYHEAFRKGHVAHKVF